MSKPMSMSTALLAAVIASSLFLSTNGVQSADTNKADVINLSLNSAYLSTPIQVGPRPCRRITLTGTIKGDAGSGTLALDPNGCVLNSFGDTQACTLIATFGQDVKFQRLQQEDPRNLGRILYSVTGDELPKGIFLVVPTNEKAAYRFVLGQEAGTPAVVTLEPSP
jgi:hypothetical protein